MAFAKFKTASVRGIVTAIPPVEKCIDDEAELYGGNPRQIAMIKKTIASGISASATTIPARMSARMFESQSRLIALVLSMVCPWVWAA